MSLIFFWGDEVTVYSGYLVLTRKLKQVLGRIRVCKAPARLLCSGELLDRYDPADLS